MNTTIGKQEHTSRHSHGLPALRRKLLPASLISLLGLFACGGEAWAGGHVAANTTPSGGTIVGGSGSIAQNGANTTVVQKSQMLALNWQTFNVGENASVVFKQPSFTSVALNRILDQNASQIFGHVNANGQIFLINTHGIIFGRNAQVNVGGLVASTLDLTPSDFLANHFNLDAHGGSAGIVNHGTIEAASGGSVNLIGGQVKNDGLIVANYGHINLDGADRAVLDFDGDGLINVQVTGALQKRLNADEAAVTNKGSLKADNGTVVLQASAAKELFTDLVNNAGVIQAGGISTQGGKVQLIASGGNAVTSGTIDVSGAEGGSVQVLSDQNVAVTGNIDASGTQGGGSIRVGGGYQGGEGLQTAAVTYVGQTAALNADATRSGNGGSVVVWGNQGNNFYGTISARGGVLGGNGGKVETSAHQGLNVLGQVDASAPKGAAGTWLLDPYNVTIQTGGAAFSNPFTATSTSTISPTNISSALTGGTNVFVFTNTAGNGTDTGNITVNNSITASGAGSLYLQAVGSIFLNANIRSDGSDALNVNLWANYGGAAQGTSYVSSAACSTCQVVIGNTSSATISTTGGNLDIETGDATNAGGSVSIGHSTHSGTINLGSGTLTVDATGITQTTGGGSITAGNATLNAGNGVISLANTSNDFSGTMSLSNSGANNVTIDNGGNDLTLGAVSMGSGALSVAGGFFSGITLDNNITTAGTQTYNSTVTLGASNIALTGTSMNFTNGVSGTGDSLTVNGNAIFAGSSSSLGTLSVTGTTELDADVTTSGTQTYTGNVSLPNNNVTLTGTSISLNGGVDDGGGGNGLTITGNATLAGNSSLQALSVSGSSALSGTVVTTGTQHYSGAVTLNGDTTLTSTGSGGGLTFGGTVDGVSPTQTHALTINAGTHTATFNQAIGSLAQLSALTSLGTGKVVLDGNVTAGTQSYAGNVQLGSGVTQLTAANVTVSGGITGNAGTPNALAITGNASLAGTTSSLASLVVSGTSTLNGSITTNATQTYADAVTLAGNTTLSGSTVTLQNTLTGGTHNLAVTGNAVLDGNTLGLGTLSVSGSTLLNADVTTSGTQTYTGAVTLGQAITLDSTGANVAFGSTIDNATATQQSLTVNALSGKVSFGGAVGAGSNGALAMLTTGSSTFSAGALNVGAGGLSVTTTGGAITQGGAFTVSGSSHFNAGANAITLTNAGNDFIGNVLLTNSGTNNVTLSNNGNPLLLGNISVGSGALDLTGAGITQASGNIVQASGAGGASFHAGTNALTLNSATNSFTGAVSLTGGNTQIASGSALNLGAGTISGTLTVSNTGAISESGALAVTGAASFTQNSTTAGSSQDIALDNAGNNFQNAVTFSAATGAHINNLALTNTNTAPGALTLPASITGGLTLDYTAAALALPAIQVGGNLSAISNGATGGITQNGALTVTGTSAFDAGSNAITLTNGGNDFGQAVMLTGGVTQINNGPSLLTLGTLNTGSLTVGSDGALDLGSGSVNGALTATSNGAMTQDGALTVTGAASFTQSGSSDILLGDTGNHFENTVSFAGTQIRNLSFADGFGAFTSLTLPASISGNLTLNETGAAMTLPATQVGGTLDITDPNGIDITGTETTGGGQTYHNAVTLTGNATLNSTGSGAIDFKSTVTGPYTLTLNTGGAAKLEGVASLASLNSTSGSFDSKALTLTGDLSITTTAGAIAQGGAYVVNGTSAFNSHGNAITLTAAGNSFTGAVSLTGGTTLIDQGSALTLGTLNTGALTVASQGQLNLGSGTVGGALNATSNGNAILQAGALTVTGLSNINAGSSTITLTSANDFGSAVTLTGGTTQISNGAAQLTLGTLNTGALTATSGAGLNLGSGTVGGALTASGSGLINQNGALTVNGAATITQNGSGQDVLLANTGNQFKSTVSFGGAQIHNLTFANAYATSSSGLSLPASITGNLTLIYPNAGLTLPGTVVGGTLTITAGNGITINGNETTGGGQVYNNAVTLAADATLRSTGNGDIDFASTVSGGHVLTLNTGGNVLLGNAALNGLASTSNTFTAGTLNINGSLSVITTGGMITQSGGFVVSGASNFNAGGNAITLKDGGNAFAGAVSLTGGDTQISQGSALTLGVLHTGSLTATSQGNLNLGSGTISGDLNATSNGGAISQGGALSVSGNSTINGGSGAITLANAGNAFGGSVNLTGGATQITDGSALNLGTLSTGDLTAISTGNLNLGSGSIGGNLAATSNGGAISQTGALTVAGTTMLNGGNGSVTLTNSGNVFTNAVTATGAGVSLNDTGDLTVASLTDNANGSVNLTAGGTLTTYGISAGSGDIALASNGGTLSTGGAISGGNIALTGLSGITSSNTITASGALTMNSAQGGISSSGGITAGTLTGSSGGATALNGSNAIGTLGAFSANGFSLSNGQSLTVSGPVTGNTSAALNVTSGDLILNNTVSGTNTTLSAVGTINEGSSGGVTASTLTGSAGGAATLDGSNQVGTLGNFSAANFSLIDGQALTVAGTVNGGAGTSLTTNGGSLAINGSISGTSTALHSAGGISETGSITAGTLSGSAAGAATLTGKNQVGALGNFTAAGLSLTDGQSLTVNGAVNGGSNATLTTTTGNITLNGAVNGDTVALYSAGAINEGGNGVNAGMLTGSSAGATMLTGINKVTTLGNFTANGFSLTNAQALTVAGPVNGGSSLTLTTTSGGIALNGAVSGAAASLNAAGTLAEGSNGVITAGTLSGNAGGVTTLTGLNKVDTLGDFRSLSGFSFDNDKTLTLSSVNGSSYVVDAGSAPVSFAITHGNLYQSDHTWTYDGTGSWSSTGAIGTQANPIYVTGTTTQYVPLVGSPPAYFYAVDPAGAILPIVGDSVNIPTSLFSSRAQNVNNHLDSYIDASVITANYRSFGIVPSGILLPPDQQSCQAGGGADCPDE